MKTANHKEQEMINCCDNRLLSTEDNKSPLQLHQTKILKHQVVDSMIDPDALHYLSE